MTKTRTAKQWMANLAALGFLMIFGIAGTQAQYLISIRDFKSLYEAGGHKKDAAVALSNGLMAAFQIANAEVESRGDALLFCSSDKLVMNGELLYRQTLYWSADQESRVDASYPVGALIALKEALPCE